MVELEGEHKVELRIDVERVEPVCVVSSHHSYIFVGVPGLIAIVIHLIDILQTGGAVGGLCKLIFVVETHEAIHVLQVEDDSVLLK
jgi:hypothetical protein